MGGLVDSIGGALGLGESEQKTSSSRRQESEMERQQTSSLSGQQTQRGTERGTQVQNPWDPQAQYLTDLWGRAAGAETPGPSAATQQGQSFLMDQAQSGFGGLIPQTMDLNQFLGSTNLLGPESNPFLRENVDAMRGAVQENLGESLNQIDQQAVASGQFGGSRQGVAQGQAIDDANQTMADTANQMYMQNYLQGLQTLQNQIGMAPQLAELGIQPGNIMTQVGAAQEQAANPWTDIMNLANIIQAGNWGGTTTREGTTDQVRQQTGQTQEETTGTASGTSSGTVTQENSASPLEMFGQFASAFGGF